jgi:hypothetical protein
MVKILNRTGPEEMGLFDHCHEIPASRIVMRDDDRCGV